jgi:uncharacterized protein
MKDKIQTVLITGATSGIGYDFATIFAEKGCNLFLASRNQEKLDDIKVSFEKKYDISVMIMAIDLSVEKSADNIYNETLRQNVKIDILINNAGFGLQGEHINLETKKIQEMIHLNITTLTELCTFFGREMKERKKGYILNIASIAAYQPVPYLAAYSATKSYVLNFSEALAKEMEDYHVVVTCLSPGATSTNFFDEAGIGDRKKGLWANATRMESRKLQLLALMPYLQKNYQ